MFLARAARARALAARARMFVTSRVLFFPNQQYKAVCTHIYTLNFKINCTQLIKCAEQNNAGKTQQHPHPPE
jgi:hypothetical protein